jgi:DNA helicase II / ATP-dependent DNA helicase PcrA
MVTLLDRLKVYINSDDLTDEQRLICKESGSFVVRACPGSGKTRTVGTRLAWLMANWNKRRSGIAALSFTNVAWQEIGKYLHDVLRFSYSAPHPHFLGTIDSFVNKFILSPFGHTLMKCQRKPEVVHPDSPLHSFVEALQRPGLQACMRRGCKPTSFDIAANGDLEWRRGGRRQPSCNRDHCLDMKRIMVRAGYALPNDAMYWGMKVLSECRQVPTVLSTRFPEIIVDEAQDTTEIQFEILMQLWRSGTHLVLVGDPDQSIFEFGGGRPDKFLAFVSECGKTLHLSNNFRSSEMICDAVHVFSSDRATPPGAAALWHGFKAKPTILKYDLGDPGALIDQYRVLLAKWGIDMREAAVLCRTHDSLRSLSGDRYSAWPSGVRNLAKILARAATYRDNHQVVRSHDLAMAGLSEILLSETVSRRELQQEGLLKEWKRLSYFLLLSLPSSQTRLAEWGAKARIAVEDFLNQRELTSAIDLAQNLRRVNGPAGAEKVSTFVQIPPRKQGITFKVIHQAKGETYDAVLVVAQPSSRNRPSSLTEWLSRDNHSAERRVGYVAVTRPRKLLVLGVPANTPDAIINKLLPHYVIDPGH